MAGLEFFRVTDDRFTEWLEQTDNRDTTEVFIGSNVSIASLLRILEPLQTSSEVRIFMGSDVIESTDFGLEDFLSGTLHIPVPDTTTVPATQQLSKCPTMIIRRNEDDPNISERPGRFDMILLSGQWNGGSKSLATGLCGRDLDQSIHSDTFHSVEEILNDVFPSSIPLIQRDITEGLFYFGQIGSLSGGNKNQIDLYRNHRKFFDRKKGEYQDGYTHNISIMVNNNTKEKSIHIHDGMCRLNLPVTLSDEYDLRNMYVLAKYIPTNDEFEVSVVNSSVFEEKFGYLKTVSEKLGNLYEMKSGRIGGWL